MSSFIKKLSSIDSIQMCTSTNELLPHKKDPKKFYDFYLRILRIAIAEFIGTTLFLIVGILVCSNMVTAAPSAPITLAVGNGLCVGVLVAATWTTSKGQVNPVITLAIYLAGHTSFLNLICNIIAQVLGCILGAGIARLLLSFDVEVNGVHLTMFAACNGGGQLPAPGVSPVQAAFCEMMLTFFLVTVCLVVGCDGEGGTILAPFCIGVAVMVGIIAGYNVSGGSMNPVRSLGPAIMVGSMRPEIWTYHYVYWIGPTFGSLLGVLFYRMNFADGEKRLIMKPPVEYEDIP